MTVVLEFSTHAQTDSAFEAYKVEADATDPSFFLIMARRDRKITMTVVAL